MTDNISLPERVTHVTVDGKDVYLVGTAHLSKESVQDVRVTIEQVQPEAVCIELCKSRYEAMIQADNWSKMDIFKVIRQKKALFLLAQLILSSFYRRLGEKLGIEPGAEMREGIRLAEETGSTLVLADRDIEITLKRVWACLRFWSKLRLAMQLTTGILAPEEIDAETIESLKQRDQLESIMAQFAQRFPDIKRRLIDERDTYLAQKIRGAPGKTVVAVVGAGHVNGIKTQIQQDHDLTELMVLPPKSIWPRIVGWGVPALIVAMLIYGFTGGLANGFKNLSIWILVTGTLSAVGALLALAHPLAILSAFVAAPIATLHPLLATGWASGAVQAIVKKPTVRDFEDLPDALSTLRGFWTNPVIRVLLVTVLTNLGAMISMIIAGIWIGARSIP
jgi:pheromone shutdown-related protein TraB